MSAGFHGDFAKLVPQNHVAQLLFSETFVYVEKNDTFHFQFLGRTGSGPLQRPHEPVEESTDYDTCPENERQDQMEGSIPHAGHFILSFNRDREPEMSRIGWRVGKGTSKSPANRGVDLLLSKPGDKLSKSLASIHMLFRFNPRSGFLMLVGGSQKADVEMNVGGTWEKVGYKEERLVCQTATMLRAGACEYELQYTVVQEHREFYFEERDAFLETRSPGIRSLQPSQLVTFLPGDSYVVRGRYLEFGTQGFGTFGWVTQGVDTRTGDPIAIKELQVRGSRSRLEVIEEVNIGRRFLHYPGLLPNLDAWCEHGYTDSCCDMERFYIFMPQALSHFSLSTWNSPQIPQTSKLQWLREILQGIKALHEMGIMHRDIRLQNMLIMSTDPGRASLCDYGKAVEARSSSVTTVGPIHTLAPEVWTCHINGPYTAKIDMWAYGYAIAEILGYSVGKFQAGVLTDKNPVITHDRHEAILKMLRGHHDRVPEDRALVDVARNSLQWRPGDRWSAAQALEHECWSLIREGVRMSGQNDVRGDAEIETEPPRVKRSRPAEEHRFEIGEPSAAKIPEELPTQELSQLSQRVKGYIQQTFPDS